MTEFAEEARSRAARLLRMAGSVGPLERARLIEYANATPEPPVMGSFGIGTTGCPDCRRTMWQQRDADGPVWVCAFCGRVEAVTVRCPHCDVPMEPPPAGWFDRWRCPACPRVAATGDGAEDVERRERDRRAALNLLDGLDDLDGLDSLDDLDDLDGLDGPEGLDGRAAGSPVPGR
ncbi:hypothetical protein RKE29_18355 [Streptomyces sp. B1866]|uniref:hypothetical protein n=1 Tax=Streptomyces sp. B1866 TaxID=3075431 RepID=UPI0028926195|nr:hypothetical protein [Streptomyces sp. B1866]MDT3398586.1 hypothetical protein [Streptomyces sp. B1866]